MRIDKPICGFTKCRNHFDGNCMARPEDCEYHYLHLKDIEQHSVEERKVGHWVDKKCLPSGEPVVQCSLCGCTFCDKINNHYFMYHFCPNCGARMKN